MKILGLDQATTTGFAVAEGGAVVESGTWELADRRRTGESRGMRYVRFRQALAEVFGRHPDIRLIVHEQTLLRGGAATEIANGLKALILETAVNKGVEVSCVHATELKKWATGSGRADKAAMVEACRRRSGRDPRDDNEADAILIALWGAETLGAEGPGPLPAAARRRPSGRQRGGRDSDSPVGGGDPRDGGARAPARGGPGRPGAAGGGGPAWFDRV
jgi:Holliday junction resolvasome RuvABC endonuclease subunit